VTGLREPLEALLGGCCSLPLVLGDMLPGLTVPWLLPEGLRLPLLLVLLAVADGMASWAKGWRRGLDAEGWGVLGVWFACCVPLLLMGWSPMSSVAVEEWRSRLGLPTWGWLEAGIVRNDSGRSLLCLLCAAL
jgi:hypothetical protein